MPAMGIISFLMETMHENKRVKEMNLEEIHTSTNCSLWLVFYKRSS